MFKKMHPAVLWVVILLVLPMCLPGQAWAAGSTKVVLAYADLSDSTQCARDDYRRYFDIVLNGIGEGDRLVIGSIRSGATAQSAITFNEPFPVRNSFLDPVAKFNAGFHAKLTTARQSFDSLMHDQYSTTPILDTLEHAARVFASFPMPRRVIILFSDMEEYEKEGINLATGAGNLSDDGIRKLIASLKGAKRIPDLSGVRIYVAGARDKDARVQRRVAAFWVEYFREAKADFSPDRYGAELLAFPECPECTVQHFKPRPAAGVAKCDVVTKGK